MHALHIDFKKLRYLMEFFASLFPKQEIDTLVGQLEDSYRMISAHSTICRSNEPTCYISPKFSPAGDAQGKMGLVAIGFLVEKLASGQQEFEAAVCQAFAQFAAAPNRKLFRQLFDTKDRIPDS